MSYTLCIVWQGRWDTWIILSCVKLFLNYLFDYNKIKTIILQSCVYDKEKPHKVIEKLFVSVPL